MKNIQNKTQAITQAVTEAAWVVLQAMVVTRAEAGIKYRSMSMSMGPMLSRPAIKQPTFDWSATDKNKKLRNIS